MSSFKEVAVKILQEADRPLHTEEITSIAVKKGWLKTEGKTPGRTMNATIVVDINKNGNLSPFLRTGPSTFKLNPHRAPLDKLPEVEQEIKKQAIVSRLSAKQKGDIAEARIAELVTLYGETEVSCFKPISDDEGIDMIVKPKGKFKTLYVQVKSRFGTQPSGAFTAHVKTSNVVDNYSLAFVFCYFDTSKGDIDDYVWFVPAPDFLRKATRSHQDSLLRFVAGRTKSETNKWDEYLIEKQTSPQK